MGTFHPLLKETLASKEALEAQRRRQSELIGQLRTQLEELESYAYEAGDTAAPPSNVLLERQKIVMEQLKSRLNLNTDLSLARLSEEELRSQVDSAVGEIVNPLRMKSHLVQQLMTQITDLEMFIQFLQSDSAVNKKAATAAGG